MEDEAFRQLVELNRRAAESRMILKEELKEEVP